MHAIKSQVNEKPRDFIVDLKRKRSLFKVEFSEDKVVEVLSNLNFLVFLGVNCFILRQFKNT